MQVGFAQFGEQEDNKSSISYIADGHADCTTPKETAWKFLPKLNIHLLNQPSITILGIYPVKIKTHGYIKCCLQMFITALFIITKKLGTIQMSFNWKRDKQWTTT